MPEEPPSSDNARDPYEGRAATHHERLTGQPWDASYRAGTPPWDAGHPQPAVVRLVAAGSFESPVMDAGCGTGENALHIAASGLTTTGVDVAATAIELARTKAADRAISVAFRTADALQLGLLGQTFQSILDCGLFHTFDDQERERYVRSLATVTAPGGCLHLLCFSDAIPGDGGPRHVSRAELRASFSDGWSVEAITSDRYETKSGGPGAPAWLARIRRV